MLHYAILFMVEGYELFRETYEFCCQKILKITGVENLGGRHLVDIIGDISWTKGVTSRGHFWRHFVDKNVHEMSSFWVTFRGHFLDDISWTFFG